MHQPSTPNSAKTTQVARVVGEVDEARRVAREIAANFRRQGLHVRTIERIHR